MTTDIKSDAPKFCFSYIRFSSLKQAAGDSLRRQLEIAPRIAKEKGWTLRDDLSSQNLGVPAFKGKNLETIKGIIAATKEGKIPQGTVMIIEAFDRFSRADIDTAEDVLKATLRSGLEVYVDRGSHHLTRESLNKPLDRIIALLELAQANESSAKLSDRLGKVWMTKRARAADGIKATGMTPAWVESVYEIGAGGKRYVSSFTTNAHKATVERIFNSYANGKGVRTIMRELNKDKVAPFGKGRQNKDGAWSSTHIHRILGSRTVIGESQPCRYIDGKRTPEGDVINDYYPVIIERSLFYKVQELLGRNERVLKKTGRVVHGHSFGRKGNMTNLFTGLVKCALCGSSMSIKQSGGKYDYVSLVCSNALRGNGCKYHTIQLKHVERAVLSLMFSVLVPSMQQTDERKDKLSTLEGELKAVERQKSNWSDIMDSGQKLPDMIIQKVNALETKEMALKRQIESLAATVNNKPLVGWKHVENTPENRLRLQAILSTEIESLTINAGERTAKLVTKQPRHDFNFTWPESVGSNAKKVNPSDSFFLVQGCDKICPYLDQVLVWKSQFNMSFDAFDAMVTWDESKDSRKDEQEKVK